MPVTIDIENRQKTVIIHPPNIRRNTRRILKAVGISEAGLSLAFVSDQAIRSLNRRFLKRDHVTDVLAFDYSDARRRKQGPLHGEIVISADTAVRQAKIFGTSVKLELTLYIIHGILHLLGYDDHRPKDIKRMRAKEQKVLKTIDYS